VTIFAMIIASIFLSLVVGQTCPAGTNILTNPSFESPPLQPATSVPEPLVGGIPGWTGALVASNCPAGAKLELFSSFPDGIASDGSQFMELDSDCNTAMITNPQTVPGQIYVLSYDYSPRPSLAADSNVMNVYYNGNQIKTVTASGIGLTNTNWTTYTQLVTGAGLDELKFEGSGVSDGLGVFLDNVMLCPLVCAPAPPCQVLTKDPVNGCVYTPDLEGLPCSSTCGFVCRAGNCVFELDFNDNVFCGKHDKVKICHKQGGHKSTYKLQEIKQKDLPKHRAHGDLDPIIYYKADASGCGIASDVCLGCTDTPPKGCARLC